MGQGKKILVEFVSANPTGPMHIGNARGGAIGDCLASVLEYAGYYVEREFYINDAGNQVNKFGLSLDIRYKQIFGSTEEMPEDSYHGQDIIDHAKAFADKYGDKYMSVSEEERRKALVEYALPINIKGLETDLLKYRIKYDTWFKESSLHESGKVAEVVQMLKDRGVTYEKEGAVWFRASDFGDDQDRVLVRANGVPTYFVPDIAYHYNKLVTRGFDKAIDILGADHHGYIARMKAALTALGVDADKLDIVIMQMVRLVRGGETVKLSKRSGKAITLATLLDEIPMDAARFFFNLRDPDTHLEFDLDLAIEESSKNPVFYVQYAHARICRMLGKFAGEGITLTKVPSEKLTYTDEAELAVIRKIAALPDTVNEAAAAYNPSRITRYVYELAQLFHKFYDSCKIKGEADDIVMSRLALCAAVKTVIKNLLDLLKVDAPEKM
jgi:arginyl-tRNA synthetase